MGRRAGSNAITPGMFETEFIIGIAMIIKASFSGLAGTIIILIEFAMGEDW